MRRELRDVVLDDERLAELAMATRANASEMVADARLLLDAGRVPRAHALAVLALEEVGKVSLCLLGLFGVRSTVDVLAVWDHHTEKLTQSHFLALLYAEHYPVTSMVVERFEQAVQSDAALRLRGLYVDPTANGIAGPGDISSAQAGEIVGLAEEVLEALQEMDLAGAAQRFGSPDADLVRGLMQEMEQAIADMRDQVEALPDEERRAAEDRLYAGMDDLVGEVRSILIARGSGHQCDQP